MGEWKEYKLGDFIEIKHGFAFKGQFITDQPTENILVTPGNFHFGGGFKDAKFKFYKGPIPDEYQLSEGDIIVTMTDLSKESDTLGYAAKVPPMSDRNFLHNQRIGLIKFRNSDADKDFIYWLMRTYEYHYFVVGSASGTSVMHTSPSRIKEFVFSLPSFKEQKVIADLLNRLDDKINLLHRQNKTLEALAETLFRQWFIVDIKDEWSEKSVADIIEVRDGTHDSPKPSEIGFYLITSKHIKQTGLDFSSAYRISEPDYERVNKRSKVNQNDILISMIGTLGLLHYVTEEPNYAIKNIGLYKSSSKPWFAKFLYLLLKSPLGQEFIHSNAEGSTQEYLSLGNLRTLKFKYPGEEVIRSFDYSIEPLFTKLQCNMKQIRTLTRLRDTLLPKLMSGEVRVKGGDNAVGA